MSRAGCLVTRHLRGSGAGPLEAGLRGGHGLEHGLEAQGCSCAAAPSPAPLRRLRTSGPWATTPPSHPARSVFSSVQDHRYLCHVVNMRQKLPTCSSPRLRCGGALSILTSLSRSSIQVMMRPARLPIVRFGPLIPTPWRAERPPVRRAQILTRSPSRSAVKEKRLQRAPVSVRQTGDARPLSAARTRHAVQR